MSSDIHLGYIIIYVQSVLATVSFYEKAFGLKHKFLHSSAQYAEMQTGNTVLAFAEEGFIQKSYEFEKNRPLKTPAGAEVAFVVDDVKEHFDRAIEHGAKPLLAPESKPWGQVVAHVRDNNGFIVELCSPMG